MYVDVILPVAMPMPTLTYLCNEKVKVGARVRVPAGRNGAATKVGIVLSVHDRTPDFNADKIRTVVEVVDTVTLISPVTLQFWGWLSEYYMIPLGEIARTQMRPILSESFSARSIFSKRGKKHMVVLNPPPQLDFVLPEESKTILIHEDAPLDMAAFIDEVAAHDGTILILTPDNHKASIVSAALEPWWSVTQYDASMNIKKRSEMIVNVGVGIAGRIVVGTRAALSLPFEQLGAIVILDEHSDAYKSQRSPRFSVKDAALYLAHLHKAHCYLVSPVPSVESTYNAINNGWDRIRTSQWTLPPLRHIVLERGTELLSKYLVLKITEALDAGKKAVVFQNRRGFSSYVECAKCGHIEQCPSCNTSLTFHLDTSSLTCHYCGHSEPFDGHCKECGGTVDHRGRGTQRLEQQLVELFPKACVLRTDADSVGKKPSIKGSTEWNIMVGTQMLLDEKIDFGDVAVVGVANADNMSPSADFRDTEHTFRLLSLLARRARAVDAEFVVQSSRRDNPAVNWALEGDYNAMYSKEIAEREQTQYPPFVRLIKIELRSQHESELFKIAGQVEQGLRQSFSNRLSPMFQPLVSKQGGEHIVNLLLRIERSRSAAQAKELLLQITEPIMSQTFLVTIDFDIDPL